MGAASSDALTTTTADDLLTRVTTVISKDWLVRMFSPIHLYLRQIKLEISLGELQYDSRSCKFVTGAVSPNLEFFCNSFGGRLRS